MNNLNKDIEILKEIQEELNKDVYMEKNNLIRKEKWREQAQAIENVLWALNGKDCVIETQTHNEEVLEEYVAKLEVELKTYKKIVKKWAEHIDFCPNNFEITKCEDYDNNCAKCRLEYARKEVLKDE